MPSFNSTTILGNLVRDVELRYTRSGTAVCDISIAVNERVKQSDGSYEDRPHFFDVTCWSKTAETASNYLSKGSPVLIHGRLSQEQWQDKETGAKRSKVKIVCERLVMLGKKGDNERRDTSERQDELDSNYKQSQDGGDDIPF